jgi:hypothetical protein
MADFYPDKRKQFQKANRRQVSLVTSRMEVLGRSSFITRSILIRKESLEIRFGEMPKPTIFSLGSSRL